MSALTGLTGLYGPPGNVAYGETGRPASNWGTPVDERHAIPGDESKAAPGATPAGVYGGAIQPGDPGLGSPLPGLTSQNTPDVHSAPYPAGMLQDEAVVGVQRGQLHGNDMGAHRQTFAVGTPYEEHLSTNGGLFTDSPNVSGLVGGLPGQIRAGSDDVDQGYGTTNGFGFGFGRLMKRWFADPVPIDRTGTGGGERPFLGHHPTWQNRLDVDSQFGAAGDTSMDMRMSDFPTGTPTPYEQPANPTYRPTTDYPQEAPVLGGDWMAG